MKKHNDFSEQDDHLNNKIKEYHLSVLNKSDPF